MNLKNIENTTYFITAIYFTICFVLLITGCLASNGNEIERMALKYFSESDITSGLEYLRWGYEYRILALISMALYFIKCIRGSFSGALHKKYEILFETRPYFSMCLFFTEFYAGLIFSQYPFVIILSYIKGRYFGLLNLDTAGFNLFYFKQIFFSLAAILTILTILRFCLSFFERKWHLALPAIFLAAAVTASFFTQAILIPAFYNATELSDSSLKTGLLNLAHFYGVNANKIEIIDQSHYSNNTNAFFTGVGPWKRIFLCDTLLKNRTNGEIAAIYAHELGHYVYSHEFFGILISWAFFSLFCIIAKSLLDRNKISALQSGVTYFGKYCAVLFIISTCCYIFIIPVENFISRLFERAADDFAIRATLDKNSSAETFSDLAQYCNSLKKLARENKSNLAPHYLNYFFYATHPIISYRIKAAESYVRYGHSGN